MDVCSCVRRGVAFLFIIALLSSPISADIGADELAFPNDALENSLAGFFNGPFAVEEVPPTGGPALAPIQVVPGDADVIRIPATNPELLSSGGSRKLLQGPQSEGVAPGSAESPAAEDPVEAGDASARASKRQLVWPSFQQVLAPAASVPAESAPEAAPFLEGHSLRSLKVIPIVRAKPLAHAAGPAAYAPTPAFKPVAPNRAPARVLPKPLRLVHPAIAPAPTPAAEQPAKRLTTEFHTAKVNPLGALSHGSPKAAERAAAAHAKPSKTAVAGSAAPAAKQRRLQQQPEDATEADELSYTLFPSLRRAAVAPESSRLRFPELDQGYILMDADVEALEGVGEQGGQPAGAAAKRRLSQMVTLDPIENGDPDVINLLNLLGVPLSAELAAASWPLPKGENAPGPEPARAGYN